MESLEDLKKHLTQWLDERIDAAVKAAVDEANTKLMEDLDARFGSVENAISGVATDVSAVSDSVAHLIESMTQAVANAIGNLNPFHLP